MPWVSFLVLPIFALANAGVELSSGVISIPSGGSAQASCSPGIRSS